ncbi:MAG: M20 family metallo-hydrolase [Dysgonamonadaceae bacterium]|jgi:acetylornithine deacetylase|nr:M20 family metallo-hydrolase [Dysgonamonadaceae bacterium]
MDIDTSFYNNAADLLKQFITRPSFSREETALADFLENYLKEKKLSPQRQGNNIWLLSPHWDDAKPTVLLNSHIDTVKPAEGWSKDPFAATEEDGKIYGLGSNDAGASVVSLLQVFLILSETQRDNNLIFLASCEEEVSGENGIVSVLPTLPPIDWAIVGEPTGMQPAISEKGLMALDVTVRGKGGHAARNEGDNAIYNAIPAIEWFRNKEFPKVGPLSGAVKMSVTMIQAGTQHNVIPSECRFTVDVRTNECYTNEGLFEEIANACGCEVKARSFRLKASHIPLRHPVVQQALRLGLTPFASPTLSDRVFMDFPALKIGPGQSSRSHAADEFIELAEIREGIDLYVRLILPSLRA